MSVIMELITLYRKHVGGIGTWSIGAQGNHLHIYHATVMGGSEVVHTEHVPEGKQGRTLGEQVTSRINSRISRMRDRGYKDTIEEAQNGTTNQIGLLSPMLAQPYDKVKNINFKLAVVQKKLNGHRCLITNQDGKIIAYSRKGKEITAISHILEPLQDHLPEGVTIDGELYVHGQRLQTIASWVKRKQPNTELVMFVAYDIVSNESYRDRHIELTEILRCVASSKILTLPYEEFIDHDSLIKRRDEVIKNGFEGLMLRIHGCGYQDGVRSASLIKVKKFTDAEFEVTDIVPSSEGWGICVCKTQDGKVFKTNAPGNHGEKYEALANKEKYIGRMLTVEYAELTEDGIPFHCSATGWRDDL